ncbi:MAG: response regulator [Alphaproteobacteria bacterium]|nr:response regulator [Alphaproteobacteria bacterium]
MSQPPESAKTILLVEDNEQNMKLQTDLLQAQGYNLLQSVDGRDVLQLAEDHHPDLIIMDIGLPGVSGVDLIKLLKAKDTLRGIPILAVTAFAMKSDEQLIRAAGCDSYMAKPISINEFLESVKKLSR